MYHPSFNIWLWTAGNNSARGCTRGVPSIKINKNSKKPQLSQPAAFQSACTQGSEGSEHGVCARRPHCVEQSSSATTDLPAKTKTRGLQWHLLNLICTKIREQHFSELTGSNSAWEGVCSFCSCRCHSAFVFHGKLFKHDWDFCHSISALLCHLFPVYCRNKHNVAAVLLRTDAKLGSREK